MNESENYYALLGVSETATFEEIKRAYNRKRREFQNDEQQTVRINAAYAVLIDESARKKYDMQRAYGSRISELKNTLAASDSQEVKLKCLLELKKIYQDIANQDAGNLEALTELCQIAYVCDNEEEAISYLSKMESQVQRLTDASESLERWKFISVWYEKCGRLDEAARALNHVCQADADDADDVIHLARLFYEGKGNLKSALLVLNKSLIATKLSSVKMKYLCESLRAIYSVKGDNTRTEATLYKKMESLASEVCDKNDEMESNKLANTLLPYMDNLLSDQNVEVFHRLENVFLMCHPTGERLNQYFDAFQKAAKAIEAGKIHKAVSLFLKLDFSPQAVEKIAYYISDDAKGIKESIEYIKKYFPLYWEIVNEGPRNAFEKMVDDNLLCSKELGNMKNDSNISMDLKEAFECLIVAPLIQSQEKFVDGCEMIKRYLENTDPESAKKTLQRIELYYPENYNKLSDIFFDGKSTDEIFGTPQQMSPAENKRNEPNRSEQNTRDTLDTLNTLDAQNTYGPNEKKHAKWCVYAGSFIGFLKLLDELEQGDFPLWGILIILATLLLGKMKGRRTEEKVRRARNSALKKFGIALGAILGIFGVVYLFDAYLPQRANTYRSSYASGFSDDTYEEPYAPEPSFPDGNMNKTPLFPIDDPGLSEEEENALAAEQRRALVEYLGCSDDNLWFCGLNYTQGDKLIADFWYSEDYQGIWDSTIILLEDGTAAWSDSSNISYEDNNIKGTFIINTIERNALKNKTSTGNAFNAKELPQSEQRARIARYLGIDEAELKYYGVNQTGRSDFENNSDVGFGFVILLDDGTVAMHYEAEVPLRVVGKHNSLSNVSLADQLKMVEEYFGCSEGHIEYSWSEEGVDGDIRPMFEHTYGVMEEDTYMYLADDLTVKQLVDYSDMTAVTMERDYFHEGSAANHESAAGSTSNGRGTISPAICATLLGEEGFTYYGIVQREFSHTRGGFDMEDERRFSVVDLDGDGANEAVVYDGERGYIFREYEGEVYGYGIDDVLGALPTSDHSPGITKDGLVFISDYVEGHLCFFFDRIEFQRDEARRSMFRLAGVTIDDGSVVWNEDLLEQEGFNNPGIYVEFYDFTSDNIRSFSAQ